MGHLFQGRYKAIRVEKEAHLLELCRYVVLNPVKAGLVKRPEEWGGGAVIGPLLARRGNLFFLDADWVLSQFGHRRAKAKKERMKIQIEGDEKQRKKIDHLMSTIHMSQEQI